MRFERVKSFISHAKCAELNNWVDYAMQNNIMGTGRSPKVGEDPNRYTTRNRAGAFEYPEMVLDLSRQVREFCGVSTYPTIEDHGCEGVVVSCMLPGGDLFPHIDPRSATGMYALRCNILTRPAQAGGSLHIEGQDMDVEVGELHCYLASGHLHHVSQVEGNTPRVLWMFGAYVPADDWNSGKIKVGASMATDAQILGAH